MLDDTDEKAHETEALIPLLEYKRQINGETTVYVCENYACKTPTTNLAELKSQLESK